MIERLNVKFVASAIIAVFLFLAPNWLSGNAYWITVFSLLAINTLLVSSLRCLMLINQISLGQVGFALVGAYGSGLLTLKAGWPFWPAMIAGASMAALLALILGYPFLKVKGIYFSILTLLAAETLRLVAYYWTSLTGGTMGLIGIPAPANVKLPLIGEMQFNHPSDYYYLVAGVVILSLLVLYLIEHSHISSKWRAIKDCYELAGSVGINVIWYNIVNFTISAFFAGLSGALYAFYQHNLSADNLSMFGITMSIYLLVYMVVGGEKSFVGPAVGTFALGLLNEFTRPLQQYQPMMTGLIAILVMLFMPSGLAGLPAQLLSKVKKRRNRGVRSALTG